MSEKKARLTLANSQDAIELPVLEGNIGPDVIDVRRLVSKGVFTYDPGFMSTASTESSITYIDGDAGVLLHRGYPIDQLAEHSDYLETCYLLLKGELPNDEQKKAFVAEVTQHTMVDAQIAKILDGFQRDAHPMAVMVSLTGALAALYHDGLDVDNAARRGAEGRASDGCMVGGGRSTVHVLPRLPRPVRPTTRRDRRSSLDREAANDGGLRVQAFDWPALHVSA